MPRKKPKRHQGAAQDERFALIFAAPGPHFTGAQLGSLAVNAKARAAQLTGCPSIAAAAELAVTFGDCFDRWKARLLCGWGSSAAQGIGGRVRTPAPTEYPETRLSLRRGRSQTGPGVPAGGPVCRPYGMAWAARPGGRALRASCSTEDGRPHGAAPTVETDRPHNQGRSPHPSGLRPATFP